MLLCSCENRTGKMINPKELEDGSVQLKDVLTGRLQDGPFSSCSFFLIINYSNNQGQHLVVT